MTHYSTEIAGTLARAAADAYRLKVEARMVRLNWQADDAEFIDEDDSTALSKLIEGISRLPLIIPTRKRSKIADRSRCH